jgi:hypothetical protein
MRRKVEMADTDTSVLTPQSVEAVFMDCLFKDGEDTSTRIVAEGITMNVGFHPGRIEEHRQEIHDMLAELPDGFKEGSAASGMSFLEACNDRHGNLWTGMHLTMQQLVQLGIAIGEVKYLAPREMWRMLPGGMPYLLITQ